MRTEEVLFFSLFCAFAAFSMFIGISEAVGLAYSESFIVDALVLLVAFCAALAYFRTRKTTQTCNLRIALLFSTSISLLLICVIL